MNQDLDTRACKRLLNEIADLSDHASLTGSMVSGSKRTSERFNAVLNRLSESGQLPAGLFAPLPDSADFGEIAVEARMLGGYLSDGEKDKHKGEKDENRSIIVRLAPFIDQAELRDLVQQHARNGTHLDSNTIIALAPFLGKEYLSEIVRENLLKAEQSVAPAESQSVAEVLATSASSTPVVLEPNEQGIGHLLDMLQDPTLPERERAQVIERIRIATG